MEHKGGRRAAERHALFRLVDPDFPAGSRISLNFCTGKARSESNGRQLWKSHSPWLQWWELLGNQACLSGKQRFVLALDAGGRSVVGFARTRRSRKDSLSKDDLPLHVAMPASNSVAESALTHVEALLLASCPKEEPPAPELLSSWCPTFVCLNCP